MPSRKPTRPAKKAGTRRPTKPPAAKRRAKTRPAARSEARPAAAPRPGAPARPPEFVERLRALSEAVGVSGDERAVRQIVLDSIRDQVDEVRTDVLGNVIAVKKGAGGTLRVMVTAHMDEVGLMVVAIDSDGLLRFEAVGGLDDRALIGKAVVIGAERLPGVIGAKPVHLLKRSEEDQAVKIDAMRIDIGAASLEAASRKVKPGDRATFATRFAAVGGTLRGKALDNRAGCAALIELLLGKPYPFDVHAAFTVQEEIGSRGAQVAAYAIEPHAAFVLETTICDDLPNEDDASPTTVLGRGPALSVMDRSAIADRRLVDFLAASAEAAGLPYQIKQPGVGGTDAGAIHLAHRGVPTAVVSTPGRYIHAAAALMSLQDFQNLIALMRAALERFNPTVIRRKG